jgi:hypothetical protein
VVNVRLVRVLGAVVVVLCSFAQMSQAAPAKPNPSVQSFAVVTKERTYTTPEAWVHGQPQLHYTADPHILLVATVSNAEAVKFIADQPGHEDVPFVIGPVKPNAAGEVAVKWTIPRPDMVLIISAMAVRRPDRPLVAGDTVDAEGNLVGVTSAVSLIYRPAKSSP